MIESSVKTAIDSPYEGTPFYKTFDYTTSSINSLLNLNINSILTAKRFVIFSKKKVLLFDLKNLKWSDGSKITANDWVNGLTLVFNNNLLIKLFASTIIQKIVPMNDCLEVHYNCSDLFILDFFKINNFSPFKETSLFSGNYTIENSNNILTLLPNYFNSKSKENIQITRIKSPNENIRQFYQNKIDVTANTAFPISQLLNVSNENFYHKENSSLIGSFQFSKSLMKRLNRTQLSYIKNIIYKTSFSEYEGEYWNKQINYISPDYNDAFYYADQLISIDISTLTIVCDNYYPNKQICCILKSKLEQVLGTKCILLLDNYSNPSLKYDIRFNINYYLGCDSSRIRLAIQAFNINNSIKEINLISKITDDEGLLEKNYAIQNKKNYIIPRFKINRHYLSKIGMSPLSIISSEIY